MMRKLSIYESLRTWFADDPALEDLAKSLDVLRDQNIEVERFDIEEAPEAFERNEYVTRYVKTFGEERLPLVLVDGFPVIAGHYPEDSELIDWLELPPEVLGYEWADEGDGDDGATEADVPCPCGCGKPKSKHGFFWM